MSLVRMKLSEAKLSEQDIKELEELEAMPDSEIDYSDIPQLTEEDFRNAKVGLFYRPIKKSVTMRIDADILDWLRSKGAGYQTRANRILREAMLSERNLSHA